LPAPLHHWLQIASGILGIVPSKSVDGLGPSLLDLAIRGVPCRIVSCRQVASLALKYITRSSALTADDSTT
jgi:hypothetical protein